MIESISGITLPRASGTCTRCGAASHVRLPVKADTNHIRHCRCPTECRLSYSSEPWQCTVSLHTITDRDGKPLGHPRNDQFGDVIHDKWEVEDRIRRAQRAILNPSTDFRHYLKDDSDHNDSLPRELTFSTNAVCLQISGPDVEDLSFCDLPGMYSGCRFLTSGDC